jgi:hypothetical protein
MQQANHQTNEFVSEIMMIIKNDIKIKIAVCLLVMLFSAESFTQEYSRNSIRKSIVIAINNGDDEIGVGFISSTGYQRTIWKERARLSPYFLNGGFMPFGITDTRDQFYRVTQLGINAYLDIIRIKALSIYAGAGGFFSISRGLLGTGGWPEENNNSSEYFLNLYGGGYFGAGIRINPPNRRFAYEFSPLNLCFGNNNYLLGFWSFTLEIKLYQKK